jgi:hypothetical protein
MKRPNDSIQLTQFTDIVDGIVIANGAALSNAIRTNGCRGLAVIVPEEWTAANIGFYGVYGEIEVPLCDPEGELIVISGIQTADSRCYIAPASIWSLGAFDRFKIASLNTSTGALLNQGGKRELKIIPLR